MSVKIVVITLTLATVGAAILWLVRSQRTEVWPRTESFESSAAIAKPSVSGTDKVESSSTSIAGGFESSPSVREKEGGGVSATAAEDEVPAPIEGALRARKWLHDAFTSFWLRQWRGICPDNWVKRTAQECHAFGETVDRLSRASETTDDYWVTYVREELMDFLSKQKSTSTTGWFRVNCNSDGCVLAIAGQNEDLPPRGWELSSQLRKQDLAKQFEAIWWTGCVWCPDFHRYIVVMPRLQTEPS